MGIDLSVNTKFTKESGTLTVSLSCIHSPLENLKRKTPGLGRAQ